MVDSATKTEQKKETQKGDKNMPMWRAVGRRKEAVARVRLMPGDGMLIINGKDYADYFKSAITRQLIEVPFNLVDMRKRFDLSAKVAGGGQRGQADAVRHGVARALIAMDPELKKTLRAAGLITRDPRVKERKKPGLKRARRAPQFSKR